MRPMISSALQENTSDVFYPDSDGQPMANNTEHFKRIATTQHGLGSIFADRDDVFIAADLFWYPVEGQPRTVLAPDVMVVFGRPRGERKSYQQWREDGIAPQVVFEFLSESNTTSEMIKKALFFNHYGVQEYYLYDIERKSLSGFIRFLEHDDQLEEIPDMTNWKSPRLGIRFDMSSGELVLWKPDGTAFLSYDEYIRIENILGETRAKLGETRAELGETRAERDAAKKYASTLAEKLRALGINPDEV